MAVSKKWTPGNWASWKPFGIGEQRPNNYAEVFRTLRENSDNLPYAWRILNQGCCDGCALGTTGMKDWTLDGVHLCNIRLRLLRLNTMPAMDPERLARVAPLRPLTAKQLRDLGRLPYPMIRRVGEPGFRRISWDEALGAIAESVRASEPDRTAYYLTSRGMPNEAYYAAQKAVRAIGTNNIDNAARICHSPSTVALKSGVGVAATTCSYSDWLDSDVVVFIGSNVSNNQPVATKYLHYAKKNGARVVLVNAYREPGMERYWIPSVPESALFGTRLADDVHLIHTGGDVAFLTGVLRHLIENDDVDQDFIDAHSAGFDELAKQVASTPWEELETACGATREEMAVLARTLAVASKAVFVWSMGITQHMCGVDNVRAIVNLALSRGFVGRTGCGLMPIRGHSGVQGGAEMGAYATAFPGGQTVDDTNAQSLGEQWGFPVPHTPGMTAPEMIDAAEDNMLDVLFSVGGNFLDVLPDPERVRRALERVPLRVHMDIVPSPQMLLDSTDSVVLLPATTRYETPGGVTQTSTERRVIFSPEVEGPRIGEARPEWEVFLELAGRVRPEYADALSSESTSDLRAEIARVVPMYRGIELLEKAGDQFQYGGPHLCADGNFPTPDGRAHFIPAKLPESVSEDNRFRLSTRRGKQFNSMVQEETDALTGAARDAVFISREDADRLNFRGGDKVLLQNNGRTYLGRVHIAAIKEGNLQVHWPEGNVLLQAGRREPSAGIPDFNAWVTIDRDSGNESS